ncbi:hypothetical protein P168DRAFT_325924 [Aspergillus campestris IBT 28561]|uniref:Cysteine-rich transmembrane CYSTM domain-containing protein n=1 Tax=Aspergillus campestris (strain IBT 28561) TaxID=1392248 RepID=A0A2I1D6S7_ASPC2|nr:uncharacterized protein P168DRAFT_325924 [Aspergillus campestris IBT 28561]PKY05581.1 hypothetical protein P168DRAFT_325924 [Aspergillus campestris IBT 28561]
MAFLDFFKSSKRDSVSDSGSQQKEPTWDADTVTVKQPVSPEAPSTGNNQVEEPLMQKETKLQLRGGGAGDVCCGMCTGLLCFECCEECC